MSAEIALDPFYYLHNFSAALSWIEQRHRDVLRQDELDFLTQFSDLPRHSQALLVRLIMRKGPDFRASKVRYPEVGCLRAAAAPVLTCSWLDDAPALGFTQLCQLLRRDELNNLFPEARRYDRKSDLIEHLSSKHPQVQTFEQWRGSSDECVYRVNITSLCTRLRLLFFGSFHQDWSEFVLADLKIFNYEPIELSLDSRPFRHSHDLDEFVRLYECRERLHAQATLDEALASLPPERLDNPWLEGRRAKLLFQMAHRAEREGDADRALSLYERSACPGARLRRIRVLERAGRCMEANALLAQAMLAPESDAERQKLVRVESRLCRRLNLPLTRRRADLQAPQLDLTLDAQLDMRVEELARLHLQQSDARVFYVENALINSLFGLLCWDAIFAPVRGAFFHRFHASPMDLHSSDFRARRQTYFDQCFARLATGEYVDCIKERYVTKFGVQSPFVSWGLLSDALLDLSLLCIAPHHLQLYFDRLLANLQENCTGLPDLIQFWPEERRYRMIEVKGPGDRLQDNQKRWMSWCMQLSLPVCVLHVRWADEPEMPVARAATTGTEFRSEVEA